MTPALRIAGVSKAWGDFQANCDVSFSVAAGARHALIGPNGAGKTTLVNLLSGSFAPDRGEVFLHDERITHLPQHRRVKRGLCRTFQINALFPALTVIETLVLAIFERKGGATIWHRRWREMREELDEAEELLLRLRFADDGDTPVRTLPYGKQRLLEIAVALAARPRVLLLDEPAAGIPSADSGALFTILAELPRDVTVLFIEHDMNLVFRFAERITVMVSGSVLIEGTPGEVAADRRVREVYLGEAAEHV